MILVVGASGYLGRRVTRQLLDAGHRVRATSRTPKRLAGLRAAGAEIMPADLIDAASLRAACAGVRAVIVAAHSLLGVGKYASQRVDGAGLRALIDAARGAGVRQFVYTSAMFASPQHPVDFMRTKADVERYLVSSGLAFTILRPSAFMEWHVHDLLGKAIVESGRTTIFGSGTNPINFVSASDVAAVAVAALDAPDAAGRTLEIGGPDNVTRNEIVAMYEERLGRPASVRRVPVAVMRAMAPILRPVQPVASRLMTMAVWSETADQRFDFNARTERYPRSVTHVRDFVARHIPDRNEAIAATHEGAGQR